MIFMAEGEKRGVIIFNTGHARKRAAKMVAAFLDYEDLTTYINDLLDRDIELHLPQMMKEIEVEDPKARSRRQARKKAG